MVIYGERFLYPLLPSEAAARVARSSAVASRRERALARRYTDRRRAKKGLLKTLKGKQQLEEEKEDVSSLQLD